jgi:bifunctional DNase/RNase
MQEMDIDSIRVSLMNYQRVVILKDRAIDRYLPIWIGSPEADAIAVKLQNVSVPRPLTHDLLGSVISTLGAKVDHVVVSDLNNDTFYAKLILSGAGGSQTEVDCRPSDAIAISVRGGVVVSGPDGEEHAFDNRSEAEKYRENAGLDASDPTYGIRSRVPILVDEGVLEKAGIMMDAESTKPGTEKLVRQREGRAATRQAVTEEEIKSMSAFSDFIKDLPGLEDLGGAKSS